MKRVAVWLMAVAVAASMSWPAFADLLSDKTQALNNLRKEVEKQQQLLEKARNRSASLKNQIEILEQQIKVAELQVQALTLQIDKTTLDMNRINGELVDAEVQIYEKKSVLREAIKESYMRRRTGLLEVILGSANLSDFVSQLEYITAIESRITNSLAVLKELNVSLKAKKGELETADKELKELLSAKQLEQNSLSVQSDAKERLLHDAQLTEAEYQRRLTEAAAEQTRIEGEIAQLARSARRGVLNQGKYSLEWPIPSRYITAGFRDSDYQARFKFVHNAIDIATPQGTPVRAPADAFVAKVKFDGSASYSYIVLDHGNGMVTVYAHISGVSVSVGQFVPIGSVIGSTGGTPGTTGAGWLTTGPHLHLEVWLDGQARNPLAYLVS